MHCVPPHSSQPINAYVPRPEVWQSPLRSSTVRNATACTKINTVYYDQGLGVHLIQGDCLAVMASVLDECADMIFADPPYFLSNGGVTCRAGQMVLVNKGPWDVSKGAVADHEFVTHWLLECRRLLKPTGSIWVSGTMHIIHSVGFAMQELGFKILNDVIWEKPNPPPNLACRCFTHSTETILWARKSPKARHYFNYKLMKEINGGKQMKNLWRMSTTPKSERVHGRHPTQKPEALLERIILASTQQGDLVLDPFTGSGTTGVMAVKTGRRYLGIEISGQYLDVAQQRISAASRYLRRV